MSPSSNSNPASAAAIAPNESIEPVMPEGLERLHPNIQVVSSDVVSDRNPLRHDPDKLARVLIKIAGGAKVGTKPIESIPEAPSWNKPLPVSRQGTLVGSAAAKE